MRIIESLLLSPLLILALLKALVTAALVLCLSPIVGALYFFFKWGILVAAMTLTSGLLDDADKIYSLLDP